MNFSLLQLTPFFLFAVVLTLGVLIAVVIRCRDAFVRGAGYAQRRRAAILLLPALAAFTAATALTSPQVHIRSQAARIVVMLDFSPSARLAPWRNPAWLQSLASSVLPPNTELMCVAFSNSAVQQLADRLPAQSASGWPTQWPTSIGTNALGEITSASDAGIPHALQWRTPEEVASAAPLAPRWILTDGYFTQTTIPPTTFPIAWTLRPLPLTSSDIGITAMRKDGRTVWIEVRSTGPTSAKFSLTRNGRSLVDQTIRFLPPTVLPDSTAKVHAAGSRWISVDDPTPSDPAAERTVYQATVHRVPTADAWPENDAATLTLGRSEEAALVIPATSDLPLLKSLAGSSTKGAQAFPLAINPFVGDSEAFRQRLNATPRVGSLLIDATKLEALPADLFEAIQTAITEQGIPAFLIGRPTLASGAIHDAFEKLSPLTFQSPSQPGVQIVCLLDASASMNEPAQAGGTTSKFQLAIRSLEALHHGLRPRDTLKVVTFNGEANVLPTETLVDTAQHITPTGPTHLDAARPALTALLGASSTPGTSPSKWVVVITDGEVPPFPVDAWNDLLTRLHTGLTVIAPAPNRATSATDPLDALVTRVHGEWLSASDATQWAHRLEETYAERLLAPEQTSPLPWQSTLAASPSGTATRWFDAWAIENATTLAAREDDPSQEALAAIAPHGLGTVAGLAAIDGSSDTIALAAAVMNELLRRAGPTDNTLAVRLTCERVGNEWRLRADVRHTVDPTPTPLALDARLFFDSSATQAATTPSPSTTDGATVSLSQVAPDLYEAILPQLPQAILCLTNGPQPQLIATLHRGDSDSEWIQDNKDEEASTVKLAMAEFPATVEPRDTSEGATRFEPDLSPGLGITDAPPAGVGKDGRWNPIVTRFTISLDLPLFATAILMGIAAIIFRR